MAIIIGRLMDNLKVKFYIRDMQVKLKTPD